MIAPHEDRAIRQLAELGILLRAFGEELRRGDTKDLRRRELVSTIDETYRAAGRAIERWRTP